MKKAAAIQVSAAAAIVAPAVTEISKVAQATAEEVVALIEASRLQAAQAVNTVQPILSTLLRELPWFSNLHIISGQANTVFECSLAPTGRPNHSPGQRPGFDITHVIQALKGRPKARQESHSKRLIWHVPSGLNSINTADLGRGAYGKQILATLSQELTVEFGRSFDERTELNWTHYRLLASQANAVFECSSAPTGRHHYSPGQRPGFDITHIIQALKGRPNTRHELRSKRSIWHVPSGLNSINTADLGRCPRLLWSCPVRALQGAAS